MQENTQLSLYRRGSVILKQAITLAVVIIFSGIVGFKVSEFQTRLEEQKIKNEIALREYSTKIELKQMTKQYAEFKAELDRIVAEAETTRKIVKASAATYTSRGTRVNRETSNTIASNSEENTSAPTEYKAVYEVKATAYCLCQKCCGKTPDDPRYGETSSGLRIIPGTGMKVIAVDPKIIPLGSKVYVEGLNGAKDYGYAIAADKGSAIKDYKIDLYMDTHQAALNWGRKSVKVYVVE